jgi:arsenical pump membrane protein
MQKPCTSQKQDKMLCWTVNDFATQSSADRQAKQGDVSDYPEYRGVKFSIASPAHVFTWFIAILVILGVVIRPWKLPEALWAVSGVAILVICSVISLPDAWTAARHGTDVYFFLTGMMLLAEVARHEGLFDWLAALAARCSKGSAARLFDLVYGVGVIVTIFLSNDATAVVLTPAVYAATRQAKAKPLPYLFICAFIANAASFVLPISNPANLVVFGARMPALGSWLRQFGIASVLSIAVTYVALRFSQRADLAAPLDGDIRSPALSSGGRVAAVGILVTAVVLLVASAVDWPLGLPTLIAGAATMLAILIVNRRFSWAIMQDISWGVLPLVAGLFVLVRAIEVTGVFEPLIRFLPVSAAAAPDVTSFVAGGVAAILCNVVNNLPLGLVAGSVASGAHLSPHLTGALLIGVDLGPNLSVTGSLATILWLVALRREGQEVGGWQFLALGCMVMPPALLAALVSLVWGVPLGS